MARRGSIAIEAVNNGDHLQMTLPQISRSSATTFPRDAGIAFLFGRVHDLMRAHVNSSSFRSLRCSRAALILKGPSCGHDIEFHCATARSRLSVEAGRSIPSLGLHGRMEPANPALCSIRRSHGPWSDAGLVLP